MVLLCPKVNPYENPAVTDKESAAMRQAFEKTWNTYHTIRTITSIISFVLAILSVMKSK